MNILIVGEDKKTVELESKLSGHQLTILPNLNTEVKLISFDLIFDTSFDKNTSRINQYADLKNKPVVINAVKNQLAVVCKIEKEIHCQLIGMNLLPTFIARTVAEISLLDVHHKDAVIKLFDNLGWEPMLINDRVGMVTPRVVFMIINEACYTLQEGTASIKDIDAGMKLGTNYPYGPFEWANKIGVEEVYETLYALYEDTKDERYKICPLLKTKYFKGEFFN